MSLCLWDLLPELLDRIFGYCCIEDIKNLACCSTFLHETVKQFIWVSVIIPGKCLASKDFEQLQRNKLENLKYTKILRLGDSYLYRRKQIDNYNKVLENCDPNVVHTFSREGKLFIDAACILNTFQKLTHLKKVIITDVEIPAAAFSCLALLKSVSSLNLSCTLIDNMILEGICNSLTSLEVLNIRRTKVTDKGLYGLQKLKSLRVLVVKDCRVHDIGVSYISFCDWLKKLDISTCYVSDRGLASLSSLVDLTKLDLSHMHSRIINDHGVMLGNNLTDVGVGYLSALTSLRNLLLNCEGITYNGILQLCKLKYLTNLEIRNSELNDPCMKSLSRLRSLIHLDISGCSGVSDVGFEYLSTLKQLKALKCEANHITDANTDVVTDIALSHIAKITSLCYLVVSSYQITDVGVAELSKLNLRHLNIWSPELTNESFKSIASIQSLLQLDISSFKNITEDGFAFLSTLKELRSLTCVHTNLTNEGMFHITKISSLESLDVSEAKITDDILPHMQELKRLQTFICCGTGFTEAGLSQLHWVKHILKTQQEVRKVFKLQ